MKIVAALLVVLATNYALSHHYQQNAHRRSSLKSLDEAVYLYPHPIKTLFVGDSHLGRSVDPSAFGDSAYSLWSPGQCFARSYYRLQDFFERTDHPVDLVVLTTGLHSFRQSRIAQIGTPPWGKYVRFWEVGATFDLPVEFMWRRTRAAIIPYVGSLEDMYMTRVEPITTEDVVASQGTTPDYSPIPPSEWTPDMARERLGAQFGGNFTISQGYITYLQRIVELARYKGAQVVLITTPVTQSYWEEAEQLVSLDEFGAAIDSLEAVYYLDYHDLLFGQAELFGDPDHPNEDGAEVLTESLQVDLERLFPDKTWE